MEEIKTKVCSKCGRELPIESLGKNHTCKDGRCGTCKDCKKAYVKEWQKKNRERKKAKKIEEERIEFEKKYKVYTNRELAKFTPRELMLELKARGYEGELMYREVKVTEHRINLSKLE
jgi:hypothetical protein